MKIVTGPDFPTGGYIYGREEIKSSYLEGRGILQLRASAGIDRIGRGAQERDAIVITEIPFQVNKARLIERIAELSNEKKAGGYFRPARRIRSLRHAHRGRTETRCGAASCP